MILFFKNMLFSPWSLSQLVTDIYVFQRLNQNAKRD